MNTKKLYNIRYGAAIVTGILLLFFQHSVYSQANQLEVTDVVSPQELIGVLIGGGVETSNITYTGAPIARGKFWNGPGNIGVEEGVLLTSGSVYIAPGPNTSGSAGTNNGTTGDPDLQSISGVSSHNACVLEFDFVPQSSLVSFKYVFASEEYHEYAGAGVNDAFGFFISGPGINGPFSNNSINIALIPLSTTYVSINTVNNGPQNSGPCTNCQFFVHNNQGFVQYDAFTTVLTAWATVTPCETYHIKLAIGDGGDGIYDSGVFLEANSFNSQGVTNEISFDYGQYHQHAIEGCNSATVSFELAEQTDFDYWMPLIIGGSATNGVDYLQLPDSVFFPIGYSQAEVEVIPFEDGNLEWVESVNLVYNSSLCGINYDTASVQIRDYGALNIETTEDTTINCNTSATIGVTDIGGHGPYTVVWSTGDTTDSITVSPLITSTYYVTVVGLCDSTNTDSVRVVVNGPKANAGSDQSIPYGTTTTLEGSASQGSGEYSYAWEPAGLLDDPTSPTPLTTNMELTTFFTLTVTDLAGGCLDADEVMVQVTGGPLGVNPVAAPQAICFGESSALQAYASGGTEDYTYTWTSDPPGFESDLPSPTVFPDETTTYFVLINDGFNIVNGQVTVEVLPLPEPDAGEDITIPHGTTTQLSGSGTGGSGSYEYYWEPSEMLLNPNAPNPTTVKLYGSTLFNLTVVDANTGCISADEDAMNVIIDGGPLTVNAAAIDSVICDGDGTQLYALGSGGNFPEYTYKWTSIPAGFNSSDPEPMISPLSTTTFVVEIDDGFNLDHDTITINVSNLPPVNLGSDMMACPYDSVELEVTLPGMTYYWSNGSTEPSIKVGSTGIGYDVKNLWVEVEDELGCVGVDSIQIVFDFSQCFGIDENSEPLDVRIFPNPGDGLFNFSIDGEKGPVDITVIDLEGQVIYQYSGEIGTAGTFERTIDLSSYSKGVYFTKIFHDNRLFVGKILIQ